MDAKWVFVRAGTRLEIRRGTANGGLTLAITLEGEEPRTYRFGDESMLARVQSDMEQFLLRTGWSLLSFSPQLRSGADRRDWPRLVERRRWWTDGVMDPTEENPRGTRQDSTHPDRSR